MENQEEIEEIYKKRIEESDKQFLEEIRNPQKKLSSGEIEKNYKENLNLIKQEYEKKYALYFQEQKNSTIKNKKNNQIKKEKGKRFIVKPLDLKLTKKERFFMKWEIFWFKLKTKRILRRKIPDSWKIFYLRIKIKTREFFILRKNLAEKNYQKTKTKLIILAVDLKNKTVEISKEAFHKFKEISIFLLEKIKSIKGRKTEEGDKKDKFSEEEIAQKILKNQDKS